VTGRLAGVATLVRGRFAMIEDGPGVQLVPWQPVLEKRLDQHISGVRRDEGGIEWSFCPQAAAREQVLSSGFRLVRQAGQSDRAYYSNGLVFMWFKKCPCR
jgi:hypothetical protein